MHFTYAPSDSNNLSQGDLIRRTEAMNALLRVVHPHYSRRDYPYLLVLTQSCDLVRRVGQPCSSRYITLAAVRPLRLVLEREVQRFQYDPVEVQLGFCDAARRAKMQQFVERLLNNNEEEYFYLHREASVGFGEDHCAFLKLSIAVKAQLHYETLLAAKVLQLTESFQHKLGHMVGTMYSRVGTQDWVPSPSTEAEFRQRVSELVDDVTNWIEHDLHVKALKELKRLPEAGQTETKLLEIIEEIKGTKTARIESALDAIEAVLSDAGVAPEERNRIRRNLANSPDLRAKIK